MKFRPADRDPTGVLEKPRPHPPDSQRQPSTISLDREETNDRILRLQKEEKSDVARLRTADLVGRQATP
jgi:hypothetical protein